MRVVNLSDNCIDSNGEWALLDIINGNCSIVNFDVSSNPVFNEKLKSLLAIKLMKNFRGNLRAGFKDDSKFINKSQLKIKIPLSIKEKI
jgi:hypothetical protein